MIRIFFLIFFSSGLLAAEFNFSVKKGDTLSGYFREIGLSDSLLINLVNSSSNAQKLNNLVVGRKLKIITEKNRFKRLKYDIGKSRGLVIDLVGYRFFEQIVNSKSKKTLGEVTAKTLTIRTTLSAATKRAGLNNAYLTQILDIIKDKINVKTLYRGDKIKIFIKDKKVIALIYNNKFHFYLWNGYFYNNKGVFSTNIFAEPLKSYKRISSGYTLSRYHPILKKNLPHRAIDYAANKGTPIYATAAGKISYKGYNGPLGNTVKIDHKNGYQTVYAHLSAFKRGMYVGKSVKQGQIIGFVGSTGRSTGNHLHYELKKDGKYKNPLKHKAKVSYKLQGNERKQFLQYIRDFKW